MTPFVRETGIVAPLDRANVDTDQIIPKQFLKRVERTGFGEFLFFDWRYNADGSPNSSTKPAPPGSVISVFVNGLSADPRVSLQRPVLYAGGGWSVTNYSQLSPFVLKADLQVPSSPISLNCQLPNPSACTATFKIYDLTSYLVGLQPGSTGGLAFGGTVYVTQ